MENVSLISYHMLEESIIGTICLVLSIRIFHHSDISLWRPGASPNIAIRNFLFACGFLILGVSSFIHASIHLFFGSTNLLYQTLIGYLLGLLLLAVAFAVEKNNKIWILPFLYIPTLFLLTPKAQACFPHFGEFRPMMWIGVAYLSGVLSMLFFAAYYLTRDMLHLGSAGGFFSICLGSIFLFFPSAIGSHAWLIGHFFRPIGFVVVLACFRKRHLTTIGSSILYRALNAFCLLASLPLLIFGTFVFYQNISHIRYVSEKMLIFILLLITLSAALIFGLGMIIRLVKPILILKKSVESISDTRVETIITIDTNDEIGQLALSFNQMMKRLSDVIEEQQSLCRLAATGELAATLAHEIKNPLNAISASSQYINKNYKGSLIRKFIKIINDEVNRINKLATSLLHFSKPIKISISENDINRIIQDTVDLVREEINDNNIEIIQLFEKNMPMIFCDPNQIKQILINLFINANDSMPNGGSLTITSYQNNSYVCVDISDSGHGIPSDAINKIFNPFYTTKTRGSGLGLAISQRIAREHGGDLTVKSRPGHGATFSLCLKKSFR